jgi:hypothetical protein
MYVGNGQTFSERCVNRIALNMSVTPNITDRLSIREWTRAYIESLNFESGNNPSVRELIRNVVERGEFPAPRTHPLKSEDDYNAFHLVLENYQNGVLATHMDLTEIPWYHINDIEPLNDRR